MAPILLKKREATPESDNNTSHKPVKSTVAAKTTPVASSRASSSREKTPGDNNARVKKNDEPASARASSSSSSSRSTAGSMKQPTKPEATTMRKKEVAKPEAADPVSRKTVKTPPAAPPAAEKPSKAALMPSQTLHKHKQAPVWATGKKKHKTNFGSAYDSGSIPCRINHGSIKNALHWTKPPETLDFSPLLVTCVEGFLETEHPFVFLARTMFRDLLQVEDAREKTLAVLPQLIPPLRVALMAQDEDIFLTALEATRTLSDVVEEEMNTYLPKLTQQIHRKLLTKQLRQHVEETLATLERNGGKEALAIIRSKIPTYVSVH
ncbi:hypothetical protein Poli38472_009526 [Pythium oligandrum]|uniref:PACRG-like protein n=1 Tax=Pythium oligandrum TaxID=41045 RepID=A0A8K1CGD7_PYTOL|nr:hypothetical protein Poli38472_009526 [Pythium oligandrum]|eukprot:TMW62033.1 hypothetical protein Poli38472_009526 [Pythium oligandrum]